MFFNNFDTKYINIFVTKIYYYNMFDIINDKFNILPISILNQHL